MPSQTIQWFPGHMAKTRRIMAESLPQVDIVLELTDARIPQSSRNPEIASLTAGKPLLTLLNKSSLADPAATAAWLRYYRGAVLAIDCRDGTGIARLEPEIRRILADKMERWRARGMEGRRVRAMIVGIPNVGKSSLVNRLSGGKKAKVEDRPGVTLVRQWVPTKIGLDLMDMPGVLWPRFDDRRTGENLAMTGAIRDEILDTETLAALLCVRLRTVAPALFCQRYKLSPDAVAPLEGHELLALVARKRGFLLSGGDVDTERAAAMLLDEFRGGKIGRISLEMPPDNKQAVENDVENAVQTAASLAGNRSNPVEIPVKTVENDVFPPKEDV